MHLTHLDVAASLSEPAPGIRSVEEDFKIRLRFVVGRLQEPVDQAALDEEQRMHNDFLVVDVKETYDNLVLKVNSTEQHRLRSRKLSPPRCFPTSFLSLSCTLFMHRLPWGTLLWGSAHVVQSWCSIRTDL